ncbi:MAG: pesticidal protein Cry7Aa [Parcubacteria group bacterium]|nr:MAG: pesticidal protein Cry7Aa [Parcubacteria group bacterium]
MKEELKVEKLGVLLEPTKQPFEKRAVLNPGCYQDGEFVHVFYRGIDHDNHSSIGYAKLKGPTKVVQRFKKPVISHSYQYEKAGAEDPRIVKLGKTFYLTYVAHDGKNALTAYATSRDLKKFKKRGLISPLVTYDTSASLFRKNKLKDRYFMFEAYYEESAGDDILLWFKDVFLFPRKFKNRFAMLARVLPDIHIIFFRSFNQLKQRSFWKNYLKRLSSHVVLENKYWFESRNIGGGAPPIYTKDGWLVIFHTVSESNKSRIYYASAALLDKTNPQKVIGRLSKPLFSPDQEWEKRGFVNDVVFPTGTAIFGKDLYIYYGAADKRIAVARVNFRQLIKKLKATPQK